MATRKFRDIYFPKHLMAVRKFTNINSRFMCTLFLVCVIYHVPLLHKKKLRTD